jgi:carotenoid cleavage dioxygenase-like enzyme
MVQNKNLYNILFSIMIDINLNLFLGISTSKKNPILFADQLIKLDLDRNADGTFSHKIWQQFGCTPSEPIFVPSPNSKAEDDGVITSVILDGNTGTSFLLILDASTFTEIARAEMEPGKFVPYNYHGLWYNELV